MRTRFFHFLAYALVAECTEELSLSDRKHHRKHHHKHGHHSHGQTDPTHTSHHVKWQVSNRTNVIKIDPTAEEHAAVDAINAHNAANSAKEAANVASKVAAHSVDINSHAQSALKKAADVLKEARAGTEGLSVEQKELLHRAETHLARATQSVEYNDVDASRYIKAKDARTPGAAAQDSDVAAERVAVEKRLHSLQGELDTKHQSADVLKSENELAAMEVEVRQLREELAAKETKQRRDAETTATLQELSELEAMIKELELAEAKHQVKANEHDEMKIELEKLREQVQRLEAKRNEPDTGTLVYEVPAAQEVPLRTVEGDASDEPAESPESGVAIDAASEGEAEGTPYREDGIDIDTAMPYGELEPFGREDTAQELTEDSVKESDQMVDTIERAEVAEEKRAVFRALTRLRGAAITSFDGVARSQTGNIDEYNKLHKWRRTHPLHHLADEESDISKWAFPDNADF